MIELWKVGESKTEKINEIVSFLNEKFPDPPVAVEVPAWSNNFSEDSIPPGVLKRKGEGYSIKSFRGWDFLTRDKIPWWKETHPTVTLQWMEGPIPEDVADMVDSSYGIPTEQTNSRISDDGTSSEVSSV